MLDGMTNTTEHDYAAQARQAIEIVCSGDLSRMEEFYSPDFIDHINDMTFHGYEGGRESLAFVSETSLATRACGQAVEAVVLSGTARHVPSGTASSCYQEPKAEFSSGQSNASAPPNLESNEESNSSVVGGALGRGKAAKEERR